MSRRPRIMKPMSPEAKAAGEGEKIVLTKQQAAMVLETQKASQEAQQRASIVLSGVLAAAGIDQGEVIGGELAGDAPHIMVRRTSKEA